MLELCNNCGNEFDMLFNQNKSFLLQDGLAVNVLFSQLMINSILMQWVDRNKYRRVPPLYVTSCILWTVCQLISRWKLLLKSCFESPSDLVKFCGLIRFNDGDALDLFYNMMCTVICLGLFSSHVLNVNFLSVFVVKDLFRPLFAIIFLCVYFIFKYFKLLCYILIMRIKILLFVDII